MKLRTGVRVVAIIQARMSSSRLPGKVLRDLNGRPVLSYVVARARLIRGVDEVVVATSDEPEDNQIEDWCKRNDVPCFRGSLQNVLGRYVECARAFKADVVVRITSDCPLIDPWLSSQILDSFLEGNYDYAALGGSFPHGLDTQVFKIESLIIANASQPNAFEREHVGPFIENRPNQFNLKWVSLFEDKGHIRLVLDYPEDLDFLRSVMTQLANVGDDFDIDDVFTILSDHPHLTAINRSRVTPERSQKPNDH